MVEQRRLRYGILTLIASWLLLCGTPTPRITGHGLPDRIDDRTFWTIVTDFSEPGGYFRSDNLVSNETTFQHVIPTLQQSLTPASAYLGVGPDQNFTYLTTLQPRIAFIVDIRRQNMVLHLIYKAIFEMSPTRADFLARLFSRAKPANVSPTIEPAALFAAIEQSPPDAPAFERNLQDVIRRLLRQHHFTLSSEDLRALDYVYRSFFSAGPEIRYSFGRGPGWLPFPSYRDLMLETDGETQRSYLSTEENYQILRELELRNLIIPIVGDFAGPKALRAVGAYLKARGGVVTAFYTSNVEQYLFRGDDWQRFYSNVSSLPLDERSTFIRSFFSNVGFRTYTFQPAPYPPGSQQTPRSQTLLNSIVDLLGAYQTGRIQSYRDVIEQSHQP
jgi:hypothetical protein